jgi:hypothetical protein
MSVQVLMYSTYQYAGHMTLGYKAQRSVTVYVKLSTTHISEDMFRSGVSFQKPTNEKTEMLYVRKYNNALMYRWI